MAHVVLTTQGRLLRLSDRDGERRVTAGVPVLDPADAYERVELPHGRVALRRH